jgi:glucose/arabinose dehydrogenase
MWKTLGQLVFIWFFIISGTALCDSAADYLHLIKLPPGFVIDIYTDQVPGARSLAVSPGGTLFVGTRHEGQVYAVLDRDRDQKADQVIVVARGLKKPNGVAFRDGALFVAEEHRILRFANIETRLSDPGRPQVIYDNLPTGRYHSWKFIRFGPDGKLYVSIGAPCNSCDAGDPYGTIQRMNPDGSGFEVFTRGVRNSMGFDWQPETAELWFTDNGRDWLGDDRPPDELNRAPTPGLHFGFPFFHGRDIPDPDISDRLDRSLFTPPAMELGPHVAALGMRFYTGGMFPPEYHNQILIAEHGSWNRSEPIGYRISLVRLQGNRAVDYVVFAEGWLQWHCSWGRPVDVQVLADGSLLVSDDKAGAIYRIHYVRPGTRQ